MANIVLVPGAYHGGWYYTPIADELRTAGHRVFTISLSGLAGPLDRVTPAINLDTHIDDVVHLIEDEQLHDVVLCAHSYGGMVIAGASDRLPGRIKTLVFLDALAPNDGDSVWTTWSSEMRDMFVQMSPDGIVTGPPPGVDSRARAHPLATFIQPVRIMGHAYTPETKVYVWCNARADSPFEAIYNRLSQDPAWTMRTFDCGHDFMADNPKLALDLVMEVADGAG
jgi:pimeloyl-ACP methyl ester carboxylesterase